MLLSFTRPKWHVFDNVFPLVVLAGVTDLDRSRRFYLPVLGLGGQLNSRLYQVIRETRINYRFLVSVSGLDGTVQSQEL